MKDFFFFIVIFFLFWEFFTPALAKGFSLEFEWQVSSSLQNSSQCSGRSQFIRYFGKKFEFFFLFCIVLSG